MYILLSDTFSTKQSASANSQSAWAIKTGANPKRTKQYPYLMARQRDQFASWPAYTNTYDPANKYIYAH